MSEWKTIETAPKDGTEILLWGEWDGEINGAYEFPCAGVGVFNFNNWMLTLGDCYSCVCNPTHWMPIPPPPKD